MRVVLRESLQLFPMTNEERAALAQQCYPGGVGSPSRETTSMPACLPSSACLSSRPKTPTLDHFLSFLFHHLFIRSTPVHHAHACSSGPSLVLKPPPFTDFVVADDACGPIEHNTKARHAIHMAAKRRHTKLFDQVAATRGRNLELVKR